MAKQEWALMIIDVLGLIEDELNLMGSDDNDLTERTIRFERLKNITDKFVVMYTSLVRCESCFTFLIGKT